MIGFKSQAVKPEFVTSSKRVINYWCVARCSVRVVTLEGRPTLSLLSPLPRFCRSCRHSPPSRSVLCIFFSLTTCLHILIYYFHKSLWSSSLPPAWQLHQEHPSTNIFTVTPLHMSKLSQSGLSNFVSKTSDLCCS